MTDQEKTQMVQDCESFEELLLVFDTIGDVQGTRKSYPSQVLKEKIGQLRFAVKTGMSFENVPFNVMTRTHGIRAKTIELFWYEANEI